MLQLRNISKVYKNGKSRITALKNVSIDFPEKGMVFVVGKSGAGKSTLLNILGGLDKDYEGEIIIDGKSTNDFKARDFDAYRNHQIGFVFQEFNLIDDLTVKDNIAIALKIQAKGHDATTIDEALKLVNLEGLGYRTPRELSGGQKQRISIARALVKNPNIILADEPTGAIDSKTGYELMNSLKALSNDKLIVIVTHDNDIAYTFADEIIRINDGEIIEHLKVKKDYVKPQYEFVSDKIIKVNSGGKLDNVDIINDNISHDKTNYLCLTSNQETVTVAFPELYDKIFKVEDMTSRFEKDDTLKPIEKENNKKAKKGHERIRFIECIKMAFHQFSLQKGKLLFMLFFLVLSTAILGFAYSIYTVNQSQIIADTLKSNDIQLGIMGKYTNNNYNLLDDEDKDYLQDKYEDNNFAIGKQINITYTAGVKQSYSAFEMRYFRGIVECDNVEDLNLQIVSGKGKFEASSLENHEIIISDYAAYELRRTGYLGYDNEGVYGIIKPSSLEKQIGSKIIIGNNAYSIIGIFDTNYEEYLPLLVSETYVDDASSQSSSLNALKYYYYARIFGPEGFYSTYIDENKIYVNKSIFSTLFSSIPVYDYDGTNNELLDTYTLADIEYNGYSSFTSWDDFINLKKDEQNYSVIYGQIPEDGLKGNQVILSFDFFRDSGLYKKEQYEAAMDALTNNVAFRKMSNSTTVDTLISTEPIEIVAVVDIDDIELGYDEVDYTSVAIYVSNEKKEVLNKSLYGYDQMLFTLNGSRLSYTNTIKKMIDEGYRVDNINGTYSSGLGDIETTRTVVLVISLIMLLFSFLFMMNYVSSSIKSRKKEMGILRATGAKGKDIIKIFMVDEAIIAFVVSLLSAVIVGYVISMLNNSFGTPSLKIKTIIYDFDNIIVIFLFAFVFFMVTTIIPVIKIASESPIDAMKKN